MNKKARKIELLSNNGKVILSFLIHEKEVDLSPRDNESENLKMTDAQEKYMLKILVEQGIKDDKANQRLLKLFKVNSMEDVTKLQASEMIKSLLGEKGNNKTGSEKTSDEKKLSE